MHLQWKEAGAMGTNAIVGGGVPQAAGFAWSHRHAETDVVSVTYFGDGATNIGSTLETMNLASAWDLPVCFFIENNHYAVSTTVEESTGEPRLSARGLGFDIASWRVDGMDPLAVHLAMTEAVEHMRSWQAGRPLSRRIPTDTSTRTAASRAAHSATARRRKSSSGGLVTPSPAPQSS